MHVSLIWSHPTQMSKSLTRNRGGSDKITCSRGIYLIGVYRTNSMEISIQRCIRSFFTGTAHAQALEFWISLVCLSSLHKILRSLSIPRLDFALWTVLVKSSIEQNLAGGSTGIEGFYASWISKLMKSRIQELVHERFR